MGSETFNQCIWVLISVLVIFVAIREQTFQVTMATIIICLASIVILISQQQVKELTKQQ